MDWLLTLHHRTKAQNGHPVEQLQRRLHRLRLCSRTLVFEGVLIPATWIAKA